MSCKLFQDVYVIILTMWPQVVERSVVVLELKSLIAVEILYV